MTRAASPNAMMPIVTSAAMPADAVVTSVPMTVMAQMSKTVMHCTEVSIWARLGVRDNEPYPGAPHVGGVNSTTPGAASVLL